MNEALARDRAGRTCEYCGLEESWSLIPFEIDHIIARKHGGPSEEGNLAYSCFYCNSAKGPNIAGIDPESNEIVRLFHPRNDVWAAHFRSVHGVIQGTTAVGRTTARVLSMNQPDLVTLRLLSSQE